MGDTERFKILTGFFPLVEAVDTGQSNIRIMISTQRTSNMRFERSLCDIDNLVFIACWHRFGNSIACNISGAASIFVANRREPAIPFVALIKPNLQSHNLVVNIEIRNEEARLRAGRECFAIFLIKAGDTNKGNPLFSEIHQHAGPALRHGTVQALVNDLIRQATLMKIFSMLRFKGQFFQNSSVYLIEFIIRLCFEVKVNIFRNHGSGLCLNSSAPQSLRKALFSSFLVMRVDSRKHAVEVNHAAAIWAAAATMEAVVLPSGEINAEVNRLFLVSTNTVGTQDFYFSSA